MDYKALSSLLIKLAGAFIVITSLTDFPKYFAYIASLRGQDLPLWIPVVGGILPVLVPVLAGAGMFAFSGTITNRLVFTKEEGKDLAAAIPELEAAAFSVLGAYLLFRAIADATYHLSKFKSYEKVILPDAIFVGPSILPDDFANFITTGVEFILAIYLLLGAKGLVRLKNRIRGRD